MSLVSDALRKARREAAAEQQQMQPGVVYTGAIAGYSRRSRIATGLMLGVTVAVAAAVGGGAVVWWVLGRADSPAPAATAATENTPAPAAGPAAAEIPVPEPHSAAGRSEPAVPDSHEVPGPQSLTPPPEDSRSRSPTEIEVAQTAATEVSPQATGENPQEPQERVHVIEADLGYATLSLGFLVCRSYDPYAEINGIEIHEGQHIEGFLLEKVEQDQVRLRDHKGLLILKVR